ncbi:hypothetical protein Tsubulata_018786, partial [Turnera subulata]
MAAASSCCVNLGVTAKTQQPFASSKSSKLSNSSSFSFFPDTSSPSISLRAQKPLVSFSVTRRRDSRLVVAASAKPEPLKIMIAGAPASGKGTQCELITKKYDLVHIAAGDLLRAEIASGSENGKRAREYMDRGQLVPDEIVVMMVKDRLLQPDSREKGWLLDGYPRSSSQATALTEFGFKPDIFILLD